MKRWWWLAWGSLMALGLLGGVEPVMACAYVPDSTGSVVGEERVLISWNGRTEEILVLLDTQGTAGAAAWIFPVPARATVSLASPGAFDRVERLTAPRRLDWRPWLLAAVLVLPLAGLGVVLRRSGRTGGRVLVLLLILAVGTGCGGVNVLQEQALGPLDVTQLAATDAGELEQWLGERGFRVPAGLAAAVEPYIQRQWSFVAVRLAPQRANQRLTGPLAPLRIGFDTPQIVYPVQATAVTSAPQTLRLHVVAEQRVEKRGTFGPSEVIFVDWIEPAELRAWIAPFSGRVFLTSFVERIENPQRQVTSDYTFVPVAPDRPIVRPVYSELELAIGLGLALLLMLATRWLVVRRASPETGRGRT